MSAEVLRRAAAVMRENAEAAYDWTLDCDNLVAMPTIKWDVSEPPSRYYQRTYDTVAYDDGTTIHMASWHPAVALAVAEMLESVARTDVGRSQRETHEFCDIDCDVMRALAVARAYLGT